MAMRKGGGVPDRGSYILYLKNHNFRICLPQKITTSFSIPPKIPSVSPFFTTQKIPLFWGPKKTPASFIDPKKHFWSKFQTQKNHLEPPAPSIKYVNWAPGGEHHLPICISIEDQTAIAKTLACSPGVTGGEYSRHPYTRTHDFRCQAD